MGRGSPADLFRALGEPQPCPVCDDFDCEHQFYGEEHWRIGDPMAKKYDKQGRTIPCPRRLIDPLTERVVGKGHMLTPEQAARLGVLPAGTAIPAGARKGRGRKDVLDRARQLAESRPHARDGNR